MTPTLPLRLTPEDAAGVVAMRRDLHRHPELAFQEVRTAGIVAGHLEGLGLPVQRGVGGTGVVAELVGARPGPTVLVRADMDALPIREESEQPYASGQPGVMHACGHDGHTAVLAHVATLLSRHREQLCGRVRFVFQPAEETGEGAARLISEGVLEGVDRVLGLHLVSSLEAGLVGVRPGPLMASADEFVVQVLGRGGHAASPDRAIDPVFAAAQVVVGLQALVSREASPFAPVVLTVSAIHSQGEAFNVIPPTVELRGTLRTFDDGVRRELKARLGDLAASMAAAFRAEARTSWLDNGTPPVMNDPPLSERARLAAEGVVGAQRVIVPEPWMAGEDMAHFMQRRPGVFLFVGAADPAGGEAHAHHHPSFDLDDERALPVAVEVLANTALAFLNPPGGS